MNGETLRTLQNPQSAAERYLRVTMAHVVDFMDVTVVPLPTDVRIPNYTNVGYLSSALYIDECEFPNFLKDYVASGTSPEAKAEEIDDASEDIVDFMLDDGFEELRADHQFVSLLQMAGAVDKVKTQQFGDFTSTAHSNELMYLASGKLIEFMPRDRKSIQLYEGVVETLNQMRKSNSFFDWFYTKADRILSSIRLYEATEGKAKEQQQLLKSGESLTDLARETDLLMDHAMSVRNYGVKLAATKSLFGGSLVFDDPYTTKIERKTAKSNVAMTQTKTGANTVAIFTLTAEEEFTELGILTEVIQLSNAVHTVTKSSFLATGGGFLRDDGQLYLDTYGSVPIKQIYRAVGAEEAYEVFRAEVISNFADLTLPAEIVERNRPPAPHVLSGKTAVGDVVRALVTPRKKYLHGVTKQDIDAADTRESNTTHTIRLHGVTYHRRRLLPGQNASARALELALECDYDLPFGYTFVKPHQRGTGPGKVTGHTF